MFPLQNAVRDYAWGSRTVIAELTGRPTPTPTPEAEMWVGAHPVAPSTLLTDSGPRPLPDAIAADPAAHLGPALRAEYGDRLPFLFKVLAADGHLSIQAHPSPAQARAGYADEEARGVPLDSPHRNYKDTWAKPELFVAQAPSEVLCGFRDPADAAQLLERLGTPVVERYVASLRAGEPGNALRDASTTLLTLPEAKRPALVDAVVEAATPLAEDPSVPEPDRAAYGWVVRLAEHNPGDVGVVLSLLMNLLRLAKDEGIYLGPGVPHAYLRGWGLEPQANSDNVLRGGLTPKHVDVPELLRTLDFTPYLPPVLRPEPVDPDGTDVQRGADVGEKVWRTPAREFALSSRDLDGDTAVLRAEGPQVLLCLDGEVELRSPDGKVRLHRGDTAYAAADEPEVLATGHGRLVRVTAGRCARHRPDRP